MRKVFSLASMLSLLVTPVWSANSASQGQGLKMSSSSGKRIFDKGDVPLACEANKTPSFLNKRSQSNLVNLFENVACAGMGEFTKNESLDSNYCSAVYKCEDFQGDKVILSAEDKEFLETEALDFLVRENTFQEMDKYNSNKSDAIKDLLSFIEKLPPKVQEKIKKCEAVSSPDIGSCTSQTEQSKLILHYITTSLDKKNASRAAALNPQSGLGNYNNLFDAKRLAQDSQMYNSGAKKIDKFSDLMTILAHQEKGKAEFAKEQSTDLDPQNDSIVNSLLVDVVKKNSNVSQISAAEIKEIVKKSLLKSTEDSNDFIFNYRNKNKKAIIEKAISEIDFSSNDFIIENEKGRKALFAKINNIRVRLAESHFSEDCSKTSTSIEAVCSSLSHKFQSGESLDLLTANEDPFQKIMDFYHDSDLSPREKENKIQKIVSMQNSKNQVYTKYLMYSLQVNVCGLKFPKVEDPSSRRSQAKSQRRQRLADKINEYEKASETSRANTMAAINETVNRNDTFKNEMKSLGIKIDSPKAEMQSLKVASNAIKTDNSSVASQADSFIADPKNFFTGEHANLNTKVTKPFEPSFADPMQNYNERRESKKDQEAGDYEQKLRARLADLESREKSISRKVSQVSDVDAGATSTQTSELADLKRQIEELKKAQTAEVAAKPVSEDHEDSTKAAKSPFNKQNAPVFGSKSASSDQSERQEAVAAGVAQAASKATPSSDFNPQNTASASTRSPASIGSSGGATKSNAEKAAHGIVLSKSGEVMQDPANILENPKEVEIVRLLEVTNGQPFLIRENGVLMKVSMELDSNGKPQLIKGKPRFKKEPLSKVQQETIAKETNIQKTLKEVDRDPTRLFNLKTLLKKTVKRE